MTAGATPDVRAAARLLHLLDRLRRARTAVIGDALSAGLGISLRTRYRDIASLRAQGAEIEGDPGIGYRLRAGFLPPPLMFDRDELEALVLGARWVRSQRADMALADAAGRALARVSSVLPEHLRLDVDTSGLFVPAWRENETPETWLPALRHAIREERKLRMRYIDAAGAASRRIVWPFAMAFFDPVTRMFATWCELRGDFRHFRADRVEALHDTGERYPQRRHALIRRWRRHSGIQDAHAADGN
ncbi:YafY family transcriptional regulator [Lysobacter pythonis]|uniref:YafY family transcriptional regulator n=1 Tax=Solilutibacter pythonis TaxID=2483112 RepID=A0A3M2HHK2_9GAMM|nr:YafY family protein [Lysobacter pythonis]RMH87885.1 YafY family transcriptional regulator [Lysobacter pythonis]